MTELKGILAADLTRWRWGGVHSAMFRHLLKGGPQVERLLNLGPYARGGYSHTPFATHGWGLEQDVSASYRQIMDLSDWDRSVATGAPGQSGQPGSPHVDDLAKLWTEQKYFPLLFSQQAVEANAEAVLTLTPAR